MQLNEIKFDNGNGLEEVLSCGVLPALSFMKLIEEGYLGGPIDEGARFHLALSVIDKLEDVKNCLERMNRECLLSSKSESKGGQ